ncbi:PhzF family phenazine biosynthesis protein [Clostridium hydrogenum]|uniref:PhzF family phenazine biosynthesis protein n=1 Tax=Clostridium hydrogenum TaxID=2855764 RepID=UPI002E32AEB8|nr:PhzF family phenazine biosynthesis isomerase [Clostridium hydrogenum]
MNMQIYTLNAFAKTEYGGNPAGVVLEADFLTATDMQKIANHIGFSETAFVKKSNKADFKVEFYTPNAEVDLCGHATIATFTLLAYKGIIKEGLYSQETKSGILGIECGDENVIYMEQKNPEFYETLDKKEIAGSLNIKEDEINDGLPIQIVSTGLKDILIPIKSLSNLHDIKPDFYKISTVTKKYGVVGYHLFSLETKNNSTAHCRNFAPLYDIPEEAATGTSNGALSCYLYKHGIIHEKKAKNLVFEQGYSMGKPSEILSSLEIINNEIKRVKVGGTALNIEEKEMAIF